MNYQLLNQNLFITIIKKLKKAENMGKKTLRLFFMLATLLVGFSSNEIFAQTDNALNFGGTNDYVLVSNPNDFNIGTTTNFTFQARVKSRVSGNQSQCIFSKMNVNGDPAGITGFQIWAFGGKLLIEWKNNGSGPNTQTAITITDAVCHHVAVVVNRSGTNNFKLYVDGVLAAQATVAAGLNYNNNAPVYIGRERQGTSTNHWDGSMDDVAFFATARTAAEIAQSAQTPLTGSEPGLVAYWKFNSGVPSGNNAGVTTAIDETGGNDGTLNGFALSGATSNWIATPCPLCISPAISCPSNITINNSAGQCGANVTYPPATATGAPAPTITYSPASGSFLPIGTTTVTATATNSCGSATCTFAVTVNDNQPPSIVCPGNITVNATSANGAVVNYTAPVGTDNCTGAITARTVGLASGSTFPIGVTTVTHRVTDAAGLTADCSFTVTVTGLAPVIVCPANITLNNTIGQCGDNVSFVATETTAIPASTITYSVAPGSFFAVGTTIVTAIATNAVGTSTCTFTVTVNDTENPMINCPAAITVQCAIQVPIPDISSVTASDNCSAVVTHVSDVISNQTCANKYTITRTYKATDPSGNFATCTQIIAVDDNIAPVIAAAPAAVSVECIGDVPAAMILAWTDNCDAGGIVTSVDGPLVGNNCGGTITRTWNISDACGNVAVTRTQIITIDDNTAPAITTGVGSLNHTLQCTDAAGFASAIAELPAATDNCGTTPSRNMVSDNTVAEPSCANGYVRTRVWNFSDDCGNTSDNFSQVITVIDTEAPQLTGTIPAGETNMSLCFSAIPTGPTTADIAALYSDCGMVTVTKTGIPIGDNCSWSVTHNYVITDACGNAAAPVNITYSGGDKTDPVFTVFPSSMTVNSCRGISYNVVATDNCNTPTLAYSFSGATTGSGIGTGDGTYLNEGVTTVTITATDACSNAKSASFNVTVIDDEAPVIDVMDISRTFSADNYGCSINLGASATDNCQLVSLTSNAPTCFPIGVTVVTWTATDQHGNVSTALQNVTRNPSAISFTICAGTTRTIYRGTTSGYGPFGPQSINLSTTVAGGTGPYTYSWSPAAGLSSTTISNPVASPAVTTTYTLTVTDNQNNSRYLSITINVLPLSAAVFSGNGNNVKFNLCHTPPGNPSNPQNITVSGNALNAHLTSGSSGHNNCYLGPCSNSCVTTPLNQNLGRGITVAPVQTAKEEDFKVQVSPNPTVNEFMIQVYSKGNKRVNVRLLDNLGAFRGAYSSAANTNFVIFGKNLVSGTYYAEVTQGKNRKVVKLVKLN